MGGTVNISFDHPTINTDANYARSLIPLTMITTPAVVIMNPLTTEILAVTNMIPLTMVMIPLTMIITTVLIATGTRPLLI